MTSLHVGFLGDIVAISDWSISFFLAETQFAVFGMGDSSYVFFNEAARKLDEAFEKLGATRIMPVGMGDDQHPARYDTELEEWRPDFYDNIDAPEPPQRLGAPSHLVEILAPGPETEKFLSPFVPHGSKPVTMTLKRSTVPEGYERAIDHFAFELQGSGLPVYSQGDSLGLWASSDEKQVQIMLKAVHYMYTCEYWGQVHKFAYRLVVSHHCASADRFGYREFVCHFVPVSRSCAGETMACCPPCPA